MQEAYSIEIKSCNTEDKNFVMLAGMKHYVAQRDSKYSLKLHNQSRSRCYVFLSCGEMVIGCFNVEGNTTVTVSKVIHSEKDLYFNQACVGKVPTPYHPKDDLVGIDREVKGKLSLKSCSRSIITALFVPQNLANYNPECVAIRQIDVCYQYMNFHNSVKIQAPIVICDHTI